MKTFQDLKEIIAKLRSPEGCPWDRKQSHQSLLPFLFEEANEVFDAVQNNDFSHLKEELGDLLLQIVLHAQIAAESKQFQIDDVINDLSEKLIRRHPHVFEQVKVDNADQVKQLWEDIKKQEKKDRHYQSRLDKVPRHFTPLLKGEKMQKEAAKVGFDWSCSGQIIEKIEEELAEVKQAILKQDNGEIEHEIGDLFFSVVNLARFLKINSEIALAKANSRFYERFCFIEERVRQSGKNFEQFSLEELDLFWDEAKKSKLQTTEEKDEKDPGH